MSFHGQEASTTTAVVVLLTTEGKFERNRGVKYKFSNYISIEPTIKERGHGGVMQIVSPKPFRGLLYKFYLLLILLEISDTPSGLHIIHS